MSNILDKLIKRLDEQAEDVEYDPSCAYEMQVNQALSQAGLRGAYSPGSASNFCFGTDAGADGEFTSESGTVYNLEMKNGPGQSRAEPKGPVWKEAQDLVDTVIESNTAGKIKDILLAQNASGKWKGLKSKQPIVLSNNDINLLAAKIAELQAPGLAAIASEMASNSTDISYAPLYYYFGRTGNAIKDLAMPPEALHPMSVTSAMDVGAWVSHYNSSNTYYIQVGQGGGLYYMGNDPAELGVPNFLSSAKLTSRIRFQASSGNTTLGTFSTEADQQIKILGRRFTIVPSVALGGISPSPINLDDPAGITILKSKLGYPISESSIRKMLLSGLLSEGTSRGDQYEQTLVDAINAEAQSRQSQATASIQTATKYDLDISNGQKNAKIEVKLDQNAQLGKVYKDMWVDLRWDIAGKQLVGTPKQIGDAAGRGKSAVNLERDHIEAGLTVLNTINREPELISRMDLLAQWYLQGDPNATEIDMQSAWPFVGARPSQKTLDKNPKAKDTTVPGTLGNKGSAASAAEVAAGEPPLRQVSSSRYPVILAAASVANIFQKVNYVIIGDGNQNQVSGMIATTGTDSLSNRIPDAQFSDSNIEARWKTNLSSQNPYRWTMETRSSGGTAGGARFENAAELYDLLFPSAPVLPATSRKPENELQPTERQAFQDGVEENSRKVAKPLLKELFKGI